MRDYAVNRNFAKKKSVDRIKQSYILPKFIERMKIYNHWQFNA